MSHYNDLLIRTLLAFVCVWTLASAFHYQQKQKMQKQYRDSLNSYLQELRRLRNQNAELSFEVSQLRGKK